jgi:hypothetical protein
MANDLLLRVDRMLAGSGSVAAIYHEQDELDFYAELASSSTRSSIRRCSSRRSPTGSQQGGVDGAVPVAVTAVHDLARPGGLDHELGCDHVPLVGRDSRNVTAVTAGDRGEVRGSAALHVRCVSTSRPPVADRAGGQTRNQDLEVKVGKLVLTRKADPVLRGASK